MKQIEHTNAGQTGSADACLAVLDSGTAAQREIAALVRRAIALGIDAAGSPDTDTDSRGRGDVLDYDHAAQHGGGADDVSGRSQFADAVRGVDAIESIYSALAATKARVVADAHAHAHEDLADPSRMPGDVIEHADGSVYRVVTRNQITAAALGAVLHMTAGAAGKLVRDSVRLVRDMPRTLKALEVGELSTFGEYLIASATTSLTAKQAATFDDLLHATPLADPVLDLTTGEVDKSPGAHRASARELGRRINTVTRRMDLESVNRRKRREGFEGRHVRFGRPGADGMTGIYASLPTVFTTALRTLLTDLAATRRDGDERTTDQLNADVLMTLFSGPAALAPAAQLALGLDEPSWDDDGHFTVVDERQTLHTRSLWDTIRALAAFLDLTFPDTARAVLHIDVTVETLAAALTGQPSPGSAPPGLAQTGGVPPCDLTPGGIPPSAAAIQGSDRTRLSTATHPTAITSLTGLMHADLAQPDLAEACAESQRRHRAATVRGLGDIDGELLARLARFADLQRIITDPITGQTIEVSTRRPSKRLRDAVIKRDRTCRFPGCERPASTTDLDHITPWHNDNPAGTAAAQHKKPAQTSPMNLACLCRERHRDKHQLHWQPTMLADGSIRWRNPLLGITART